MRFKPTVPYIAQLTGIEELWEPMWGLKTKLTAIESNLLHSSSLRRLQFIRHGGCSYINTHHNSTRLQHTLSVFSLVAKFCPDWLELRVAALLHDIGHGPFSHTLEQIEGIDHHKQTECLIYSPELSGKLTHYGFNPADILELVDGHISSPLCNRTNQLHLDHLDSWVRSGQLTGALTISTQELLSQLVLQDGDISTNPDTAELLLQLIISEAKFHCSSANIGPNTILKNLVSKLITHEVITPEMICLKTDAWLESLLMDCELTSEEAYRLYHKPHEIIVTREVRTAPNHAHTTIQKKLYLSLPLLNTGDTSLNQLPSYPLIEKMSSMLGNYYVFWDN